MYTIYNPKTYQLLRVVKNGYWQDASYATERAAKAQLTKLVDRAASEDQCGRVESDLHG